MISELGRRKEQQKESNGMNVTADTSLYFPVSYQYGQMVLRPVSYEKHLRMFLLGKTFPTPYPKVDKGGS